MPAPTPRHPSFIPSLAYKDNRAALKWLEDAFGFEPSVVLTDADRYDRGNWATWSRDHGR